MERKTRFVLRHRTTGLYYGRMADHTKSLWSAWRFLDEQYIEVWLQTHSYAPAHPEEYEAVPVEMTIEVEESK